MEEKQEATGKFLTWNKFFSEQEGWQVDDIDK